MSTFSTTRHLGAAPAEVFAAIRDAERLARWWGPDGFSNRFDVFEFRPGGRWIFSMIGPDGTVYPNESVFSVIDVDRRLVIRHLCQPHFELSIALEPVDGGTLLHWEQVFADASVARAVAHIVEPANEQNLDRLSIELGLARGG
ncbi:SRPBCC domain-containing protein [Zoogloea sp.]|uniref:SRPBCC domain-containing protein n=1 Tax=Zoogloea sp. TaxID=49181 RepID=UPI0014168E6E|nr:MAG: polyketide cyclase [Zoogloea sp.]